MRFFLFLQQMKTTLVKQTIEDKSVVWFSNTNQYLVLENKTAEIILKLNNGISLDEISQNLANEFHIELHDALGFVQQIQDEIYIPNTKKQSSDLKERLQGIIQPAYRSTRQVIAKIDETEKAYKELKAAKSEYIRDRLIAYKRRIKDYQRQLHQAQNELKKSLKTWNHLVNNFALA